MAALGAAREQQEKQAALASQRAEEVRARTAVYSELLERFKALGTEAAELNVMGQNLSARKREGAAGTGAEAAKSPELAAGLRELSERMNEVAEHAQGLTTAAREADFEESRARPKACASSCSPRATKSSSCMAASRRTSLAALACAVLAAAAPRRTRWERGRRRPTDYRAQPLPAPER